MKTRLSEELLSLARIKGFDWYEGSEKEITMDLLRVWFLQKHKLRISVYPLNKMWQADIRHCFHNRKPNCSKLIIQDKNTFSEVLEHALNVSMVLV